MIVDVYLQMINWQNIWNKQLQNIIETLLKYSINDYYLIQKCCFSSICASSVSPDVPA
jgi:hypothetical protein